MVPSLPCLIVDDITPESLATELARQEGRIAALSAEGGLFDIIAGRYSSGKEKSTKTEQPRLVPVHPTLARILAEWKLAGAHVLLGHPPSTDDILIPSRRARTGRTGTGSRSSTRTSSASGSGCDDSTT